MKKEHIVYIVIALVIGVLAGVIFTNAKKNVSTSSNAPTQAVPATNYQQQIATLEGIVASDPKNRNAWIQLGNNYFDSDQPMKAVEAYGKALELDGNDPNVLTDQGVMYRRLGWFDQAVKNFEKASQIAPNHQQSLYNLGIVYRYDLQDYPKAIAAWERILEINPNGPNSPQIRAEIDAIRNVPSPSNPK